MSEKTYFIHAIQGISQCICESSRCSERLEYTGQVSVDLSMNWVLLESNCKKCNEPGFAWYPFANSLRPLLEMPLGDPRDQTIQDWIDGNLMRLKNPK